MKFALFLLAFTLICLESQQQVTATSKLDIHTKQKNTLGVEVFTYEKVFNNLMTINNKFEIWDVNQNSTSNSTNSTNYGSCNPILFQLGSFSRDGPTLVYGICPDTWLSTAVSIVFLLAYVILLIITGIGLYIQRNSPHIKARNVTYMLLTMIANLGFIVLHCLRFMIGRRIFPCSIYVLSFFMVPPGILLPSVFRLWRLYFMHRLNLLKTSEVSSQKGNETIATQNAANTNAKIQTTAITPSTSTVPNLALSPSDKNPETTDSTQDSYSDDNASYWVENETELKKTAKIQHIFNILLSHKFIIATYCISFVFHILLFIFFGSIEEGIHSQDETKQRVFMGEGGFFVSSRGCLISSTITIIVAIEALFYVVVEFILLILCVIIPRDTWFIKRESLFSTVLIFFAIILFAICGFIPQISKLTDFLIPYGFIVMGYSFVEVLICVFLPILYSYRKNKETMEESELKQFLRNKKTFNILLDFARRSYCPESVLCYGDIERFKLTNKRNRRRAALHIVKTYLKPHSPLELNFQKAAQTYEQMIQQIETTNIDSNFFDDIQWHCVEDMTDVFERLKHQSKKTREILLQWKVESGIPTNNQTEMKSTMKLIDSMSSVPSTSSLNISEQQTVSNVKAEVIHQPEPQVKSPESNLDYL